MLSNGVGPGESRKELLSAWEDRCRAVGADPAPCSGPDALFLVSALGAALRRGSQTPELGRAARSWGARFSAPVEALAALSALREAVVEVTRSPEGGAVVSGLAASSDNVNRVLDQVMLEAVDAASANLRAQARTDPLTGCANRLALREDLAHAATSASRSGLDLALAEVDLDGLKRINDTKGHAAGDQALLSLVARLREELRDADTLYRTGGDEFVVIAPFTDAAGAAAMLERASEGGGPSFSWGVASMRALGPDAAENPELLMAAADGDLYKRRRYSRERIEAISEQRRSVAAVVGTGVVTAIRGQRRSLVGFGTSVSSAARREARSLASAASTARDAFSGGPAGRRRLAASVAASILVTAGAVGGITAMLESGPSSSGYSTAGRAGHHQSHIGAENGTGPRGSSPSTGTSTPASSGGSTVTPSGTVAGSSSGTGSATQPATSRSSRLGTGGSANASSQTGPTPSPAGPGASQGQGPPLSSQPSSSSPGSTGSSRSTGSSASAGPGSSVSTGSSQAPTSGTTEPPVTGGVHSLDVTAGQAEQTDEGAISPSSTTYGVSAAPQASASTGSEEPSVQEATVPPAELLSDLTALLDELASGGSPGQAGRGSRSLLEGAAASEGPIAPAASEPPVNVSSEQATVNPVDNPVANPVAPQQSTFASSGYEPRSLHPTAPPPGGTSGVATASSPSFVAPAASAPAPSFHQGFSRMGGFTESTAAGAFGRASFDR